MSFLTPLAFALTLLVPVIVALYLLKLRRAERTVSSTLLWRRMVRDVEANAPWQRLRRNLLLWLQLLLLIALIIALARPYVLTTGIAGRNLILIIDRSASMAATDAAGTRLDAAKAEALRLINQLPDGGRATIIAIGGQMEVPVSASTDRRELRRAVEALTLRTGGGSDLTQALDLAGALAAREYESEVAIISDGQVTLPEQATLPVPVRFFPIGQRDDNVAISALVLQPAPGGQTLFVQATNYGSAPAQRRLIIELDGVLFNAYDLALNPGEERSIVADVPATTRSAMARFDAPDVLPLDDRAWAVSAGAERARVRLVSDGNRFLETALGLLPGFEVTTVPTTTTTFTDTVALTVLDGVTPDPLPPGNLLFIGPLRSTELFSVTGEIEFPAPRPASGNEPLLRNVAVSEINILRAAQLNRPVWARTVIDSDGGPLLLAGEQGGRRLAVLAFALYNSDLPLQVAFPVLIANLVGYLAPGQGSEATQHAPGEPLLIPTPPDASAVRVTDPGGRVTTLTPENNQVIYAATDALGIYRITIERRGAESLQRAVAVNLFSAAESRVAPRQQLPLFQVGGRVVATSAERTARSELWRWLVWLALIVLIVEWLVYQRGALAWLRERWRARLRPATRAER
ncbi:vWA domain-containing protein [Kallotenue papyrolyticum]|uniref:vWA domain-containing protein n=1 Tax=Kallotenue papyrolyticum TaxID=1325125 RepID=UPI0004926BA3|nr:VWA domain-containing protein [Kallotenue papyrolyticum]